MPVSMLIPGQRMLPSAPPVPADILVGFRKSAVAIVSDNMNCLYGALVRRPWHGGRPLIGTAVTVKTRGGDNPTLHDAYEILRPDDVVVGGGEGVINGDSRD